ncbi:DUF4440 domain-containing protein [Pseudaminobacter soli (ex Li et al. 2025)]|uniref:DUF4440 domain-containing protein n=1 Tax=Pseudaminobacter soli (ex Li et al. 2025) TaxID=1295366 RepID=A0A2P7SGE3_9HYPH|nr:nuclear transport factor 2 family protein [Mesorhizobium soli]PSJ61558.1 DUF4440 domain-containing protein [Mesorhizobium soli]
MTLQHDLALIQSLEEELFRQAVRGSPEAVDKLLAEDFVEFGRSGGVHHKADVIRSLAAEDPKNSQMLMADDFELTSLAKDVVLLTYRSVRKGEDGKELHSLRSSIWKHLEGRWQMIFHQGTPTQPVL